MGDSSYHFKDLYIKGQIKNGSYTYTLPSATGTLALTSDLPSIPADYIKIEISTSASTTSGTLSTTNLTAMKANPHKVVLV